ncbi:cobaltochelatase subunit CobN [Flavimaricola marinus]|uniref:Cobaltochelatase subunit CobN n=1 Tax=Flavimaricola marinus TaxID=1819565 RepID=A0A238LC43_9RHOB|nr:cobaltochelatase subunit CobN [Flavimaricola marinus]SMY06516.1 Aerobic cobaltochelatase subunit CobN [Flavimaricola marinus]
MHLLAATPGAIGDGKEPVDLGQSPADVVILSAADTELALLSEARAAMDTPPSLRLANIMHLNHPLSVDMHLDTCATKSRLVIARILGGAGYWRYGFEQYAARLHEAGVSFCALPGDDKPDPDLRTFSTVSDDDYDALWSYFVEGGAENATRLLGYAKAMLDGTDKPASASPLLKAGVYWPGTGMADLSTAQAAWAPDAPVVPIVFYRALVQGAGLGPINQLVKTMLRSGLAPLPIFVASLKDPVSQATLDHLFQSAPPSVILNGTAFAVGNPHGDSSPENPLTSASGNGAPVFQVILSGSSAEAWASGNAGLSARDIAMNVALPEVDGRLITRAISFKGEAFFDPDTECPIATYQAQTDRIQFVTALTANWAKLQRTPAKDRKVTLILANYPNRDGRLANGVGLDTPAATLHTLNLLNEAGYNTGPLPATAQELMDRLMSGPTNWRTDRADRQGGEHYPLSAYDAAFRNLPWSAKTQITTRWGEAASDPFILAEKLTTQDSPPADDTGFKLSLHRFGNITIGLQPARGYNIDPKETYHSPDLIPPHNYLAFYLWVRENSDAIVHMGKHGNLEWLPGKAVALGPEDWPELTLGPMPHVYPFIVNDPGEGTQAKRRAQAVIVDHLTPPLTRAESYGPLRDLEALVDEYYDAAGMDPRRLTRLKKDILSLSETTGLAQDAGFTGDEDHDLGQLDAYLCDLKEAQIRDGLHIFGQSPEGELTRNLAIALARVPRGDGSGQDASLLRALAADLGLDFDPLSADLGTPWAGPRPDTLNALSRDTWRTTGDTVERLELYSIQLIDTLRDGNPNAYRDGGWGGAGLAPQASPPGPASAAVLDHIGQHILPTIAQCGPAEGNALLTALSGKAIAPGPSGAPTRGRMDTLPTGRNFYSVDSRAVPTPTAWSLGWASANLLIEKHLQDHGDWPRAMLVTAWGTANMRTGGDDIAQALALMGVKPKWDAANRRVTGFDILPLGTLGRPRVDVTLRVSGFFRDAFPQLIALVDSAARAIQALDEPADDNPAAARARQGEGTARVFGSKPGAYGAGLQALIDERLWTTRADLGEAYLEWGGYAYGAGQEGVRDRTGLEQRLGQVEAIVQNQDNREHDILDSDDYYQFEGGAAAAVHALQGRDRPIYHNDHSRPERPVIRTLEDEIGRVIRSRVVNPKWIDGVKRHGYKGAFEIAATVDYLFAFSATTGAVRNHHFDLVEEAFLADDDTRDFIEEHNAPALADIADRLHEAIERGLWVPRSNSARARIDGLRRDTSTG